MEFQIVDEVKNELVTLGSEIYADLGLYGASLVAAVRYDTQKAFQEAVTAGKYAADTFMALTRQNLADFWATAKSQIATAAKSILATLQSSGFVAAGDLAQSLLMNIDWRAVGVALTGVGYKTLEGAAMALLRMLIAGVIVPA